MGLTEFSRPESTASFATALRKEHRLQDTCISRARDLARIIAHSDLVQPANGMGSSSCTQTTVQETDETCEGLYLVVNNFILNV
jgi:hypothetical protein